MSLQTIDYRKPILAATYGACMGHRKYVNLPEGEAGLAWILTSFGVREKERYMK